MEPDNVGTEGRSRNVGTILLDDAENTQLFALLGKGCVVSRGGGSVEPDNVGTEGQVQERGHHTARRRGEHPAVFPPWEGVCGK